MDGDAGDVDDFGDALLASKLETDTDDHLERGEDTFVSSENCMLDYWDVLEGVRC